MKRTFYTYLLLFGLSLLGGCLNAQKPNVLVILADDMGFSDIGCYGSEIQTPYIDELAYNGVRFQRFYNTTKCSPSRAALLTGQYPHEAGMEGLSNSNGNSPAFLGYLPNNVVTMAEVLKNNGYKTYMSGKWHIGEDMGRWPRNRGFDKYWGLISGGSSYYEIISKEDNPNQRVERRMAYDDNLWDPDDTADPNNPYQPGEFYMTDATGDFALDFLEDHYRRSSNAPFYMYLSFTAPHWPLHAHESDIAKYDGVYDEGFDAIRQARFDRMNELGILPKNTKLTPRDHNVRWENLNQNQKNDYIRRMQVYAAMMDRMDQNIGRITNYLKSQGTFENTIIVFLSDNGGSREDISNRNLDDPSKKIGEKGSYLSYLRPWSNVSNVPFRMHKNDTYEGGITTPLVIYWGSGINVPNGGGITSQIGHVKDLMPTLLDMTSSNYPNSYNGFSVKPMSGKSLRQSIDNLNYTEQQEIFFEFSGRRAVRHGKWKIVAGSANGDWELFDLEEDPTELRDLSNSYPELIEKLEKRYDLWEVSVNHKAGSLPNPGNAPVREMSLEDQTAVEEVLFEYEFSASHFTDDPTDDIVYEATLGNGDPLPDWLAFDDLLRKFSGVPPANSLNSPMSISVAAVDWAGNKAFDDFIITATDDSGNGSGGSGAFKGGDCLFVVGNAARVNESDADVQERLELLGYDITLTDDDDVAASDADNQDLVVVSSTVASGKIDDMFRNILVPVVTWEVSIFNPMGMTGPVTYQDYGGRGSQTTIVLENTDHPMAAGLEAGDQIVMIKPDIFYFGVPSNQAVTIAGLKDRTERKLIFGYETNSQMVGILAPARRVGLYHNDNSARFLNESGWKLFDAAICWAVGSCTASEIQIEFTTPNDQQTFLEGEPINVEVNAVDDNGTIARVDLFLAGSLVSAKTAPPYTWNSSTEPALANLSAGTYTLMARATDNAGNTEDASISIVIASNNTSNSPPSISFDVPTDGQTYEEGEELYVRVNATDTDGTIDDVKLYIDGELVRADSTIPYEWGGSASNDPQLQNLQPGTHVLRAMATDDDGAVSETTLSITVTTISTNLPPTVAFVSPRDGQTFPEGTDLTVRIDAADEDGSISSVRLSLDGELISEDTAEPYEWIGSDFNMLSNLQPGSYTLQASAMDNDNAISSTSIVINVTASSGNILPVTNITSPQQGDNFAVGTDLKVTVDASDQDGRVVRVYLYLNGRSLRRDSEEPYEWDGATTDPQLRNLQEGSYELKAAALDNNNEYTESVITFTVGSTATNMPPTVAFTNPTNQQIFTEGDNLDVAVNANDSDGTVSNVDLYFDGQLVGTDNTAPYEWNSSGFNLLQNLQVGNHTLRTVATDDDGETAEQSINIVVNAQTDNVLPVVSFITPMNGEQVTVGTNLFVEVAANDSDGSIKKVDLYINGQFVRKEGLPPYEWGKPNQNDIPLQNLQAGEHVLRAVAEDNEGGMSEALITIQVGAPPANEPPTLVFTSPQNNQSFDAGTNLTVSVNADDSDGTVSKVDLYFDNQLVRSDNTAPYAWGSGDPLLQNLQTGTHTLRAVATDDDNATAEQIITITVNAVDSNTPPSLSFVTPNDGEVFNEGTNLYVKVEATDDDGRVSGVELYLNDVLIRTEAEAPYEWGADQQTDTQLENMAAGLYTLRAVATDDDGATAESSIEIEVITSGGNFLPIVNFADPVDGQTFQAGTDLYVRVDASDPDGSVRLVRLFFDGAFVRKETFAPYEWGDPAQNDDPLLQNLQPGIHELTALAFDNEGDRTRTDIRITVLEATVTDNPSATNQLNDSQLNNQAERTTLTGNGNNESETSSNELESRSKTASQEQQTILIYPNPASREVTIELPDLEASIIEIKVFNKAGQLVKTQQVEAGMKRIRLDISDLVDGVHLFEILSADQLLFTEKIVISHKP